MEKIRLRCVQTKPHGNRDLGFAFFEEDRKDPKRQDAVLNMSRVPNALVDGLEEGALYEITFKKVS